MTPVPKVHIGVWGAVHFAAVPPPDDEVLLGAAELLLAAGASAGEARPAAPPR
jgi:hypothetical protein